MKALITMDLLDDLKHGTGHSELYSEREQRIGINVPSYVYKDGLNTL